MNLKRKYFIIWFSSLCYFLFLFYFVFLLNIIFFPLSIFSSSSSRIWLSYCYYWLFSIGLSTIGDLSYLVVSWLSLSLFFSLVGNKMEEDKRFDYGASYSFDRPPPYDYNPNTYGAGPSSFTYNSVTNQDPMKPSAPIQSQSLTGSIQPTPGNSYLWYVSFNVIYTIVYVVCFNLFLYFNFHFFLVAVNNVQIHISDKFGPYSQNAICPHCNQYIITKAEPVSGALTWFTCLGLILIGCFICCCLIPFCCNSCRNVDHKCPNCKRKIGHYTRMCWESYQ